MTLKIGQRVLASFNGEAKRLGVVSGETRYGAVSIQFTPCDAHWRCKLDRVSAYGDANGWTNEEYRVERERSYCWERAANVEAERVERYPDAPFSAFLGATRDEVFNR